MFKVNNGNTITMCKACSKLTVKSPERRNGGRSGIFIVNVEQISRIVLAFPIVDFKKVNVEHQEMVRYITRFKI